MNDPLVTKLYEKRTAAFDHAKSILDRADADDRDFTASEQREWDQAHDDVRRYDDRNEESLLRRGRPMPMFSLEKRSNQ